jgi:uncharacterized protein YjbI with pentapeptide repeats
MQFIEAQNFKNQDFTKKSLAKAKYDYCIFTDCNFGNSDLSSIAFVECTFVDCNLSNAKVDLTAFRTVKFSGCKLLGLRFDVCQKMMLAVSFENCVMDFVSFYGLKLPNTVFKNCQLHEADFSSSDFSNAVFDNCDFRLSTFDHTILEKADFQTAYNFEIHPTLNRIKKAKFSKENVVGLLLGFGIEIK